MTEKYKWKNASEQEKPFDWWGDFLKELKVKYGLKMLWTEKGFKTYGDYRKWEENHIEERNEYFRQRGDSYGDLHTGGHGGGVPADSGNKKGNDHV